MKKILLALLLLALFAPNFVSAQEEVTTTTTAEEVSPTKPLLKNKLPVQKPTKALEMPKRTISPKAAVNVDQKVADLQKRGDTEIERRIVALNQLIERIDKIRKLSATQKTELKAKVQTEIDTLNALKAKIDADTDIDTLRADVKSIVESYRVFVVFMPQIKLIAAADRLLTVAANLSAISTKLQTRITEAEASGKDVTQLNSYLTDLNTKVTDANTQANAVITDALTLTPEGYPGNKTTIQTLRGKIKTGTSDVQAARKDAQSILKQLKVWGKVSPTTSQSPTPTI